MKEETLNVPIKQLTVNGHDFPYRIEENLLKLDLVAPKDGSPIEIVIRYVAQVQAALIEQRIHTERGVQACLGGAEV